MDQSYASSTARRLGKSGYARAPGGLAGSNGSMVDRTAYVTYLETELERITAAARAISAHGTALDEFDARASGLEAKVSNNTRLVKIAQAFSEQLEDEIKKLKGSTAKRMQCMEESLQDSVVFRADVNERFEAEEARAEALQEKFSGIEARLMAEMARRSNDVEQRFNVFEARVVAQVVQSKQDIETKMNERLAAVDEQMEALSEWRVQETRTREASHAAMNDVITKKAAAWAEGMTDIKRRLAEVKSELADMCDASIIKCSDMTRAALSQVSSTEGRLTTLTQEGIDTSRDGLSRMGGELSGFGEDLVMVRREVEQLRKQLGDVEHEQRSSLAVRVQTLEGTAGTLSSDVQRVETAIEDAVTMRVQQLGLDKLKSMDKEKWHALDERLSSNAQSVIDQVNQLSHVQAAARTDVQEICVRLCRLEADNNLSPGRSSPMHPLSPRPIHADPKTSATAASSARGGAGGSSTSPRQDRSGIEQAYPTLSPRPLSASTGLRSSQVRAERSRSPGRLTRRDNSSNNSSHPRPLQSTIRDLQQLVHSMEGDAGSRSPRRVARSPSHRSARSPRLVRRDSDNSNTSLTSAREPMKDARRRRLRELYKELTQLEVEESKGKLRH